MKLDPINRVSVVETVTERILSLISSGQVKPGERLPSEHSLAALLGVGRSSIREALRSLAIIGVVESQSGRGTVVLSPSVAGKDIKAAITEWGLIDIFEVRLLLETDAAERAAQRAGDDDVQAIADAAHAVEKRIAAGKAYFSENVRFHLKIAEASHNPVLAYSLNSIIGNLRDVRELATMHLRSQDDIEDHARILAAIRARDASAAGKAMREHLERNVREITEAMKTRSGQG
ncbi:MAG: FadR/GntR family transcriptional regulator [Parvibaculaceae bacterium]